MKSLIAACLLLSLFACTKNETNVLLEKATVTFLHSTCVKTILKIDAPNTTVGVPWSDQLMANPVLYQHVIGAGNMINAPTNGLDLSKQYQVKIYATATGPNVICNLYDPITGPAVNYDIEFLP